MLLLEVDYFPITFLILFIVIILGIFISSYFSLSSTVKVLNKGVYEKKKQTEALFKQKNDEFQTQLKLNKSEHENHIKELQLSTQKKQNDIILEQQKRIAEYDAKLKETYNSFYQKEKDIILDQQKKASDHDAKVKELTSFFQTQISNKQLEYEKKKADFNSQTLNYYQEKHKIEIEKFKKNEIEKYATVLLERWKIEHEALIRVDAVKRSTAVNLGKITEHFIPFMAGFPYNPKDVRFIGSPIDLIIFDGHAEKKEEISIIIVEVKTGNSKLSYPQQKIKDAVLNGRVQWWETKGEDFNEETVENSQLELELYKKESKPYVFHKDIFNSSI